MFPIPKPEDFDVSSENGFLAARPPLERLSDAYYEPWEHVVKNLQGLLLSKRLHEVVDKLPLLSTDRLDSEEQWRRAYSLLAFVSHAYIWGGKKPMEWVPPTISIPFLSTCRHLELPTVATYAGVVLWNWKPIFGSERIDTLDNLDTIDTFTGSLDEKWFYLVSVAIEARGAPMIPLMLQAIQAAREGDREMVTGCLRSFAERLDELGNTLVRMYDSCDPHVFYHRIRPFLAGGKNMASAGLPHGVIFDNGGPMNKQRYVQYSGGSNGQSSLIQFLDLVLGVEHRPTGTRPNEVQKEDAKKAPGSNFIHDMRKYMPGPHARFLEAVARVANLREFVHMHAYDSSLTGAFDASLATLTAFRDKHIQMVSRYIIIKSREAKNAAEDKKVQLVVRPGSTLGQAKKELRGTGGTSLIPFLRQARDETKEPAVQAWSQRSVGKASVVVANEQSKDEAKVDVQGIANVWRVDNADGGLCLF